LGTPTSTRPTWPAVAARADDLVLDVGSGPGALALQIAATARRVVGVDVSAPLVDLARRCAQAADRDNAVFVVSDAQVDPLPDEGPFDVVVSHFGSMFFVPRTRTAEHSA
jgi:ubiquinone/menaquinone biosynthesis C-methylase UbiE